MGIMISPEKLRRFPLFAGLSPTVLKDMAMVGAISHKLSSDRMTCGVV